MHFRNYKFLKHRMLEKHKGFWKAQSVHKLELKLSKKFNTKDFLMLKTIQNSPKYIPTFISFSKNKDKSELFITNEEQKRSENLKYKERKKHLYINLYKDFAYEPFLYNELQFIYLIGKDKTVPRKFNEVLKDCLIMDKYNNLLKNMKYNTLKTNDSEGTKYSFNNIKIVDSKIDNIHSIRSLDDEKRRRKRNIKYLSNKFKHNVNVNIENSNYSNTAYDGFFKSRRSKGVCTLPTIDI
jgi:hypothetical protein